VPALVAAACSVNRRPIAGRDIAVERVRAIVPNETTAREVTDWFGPPDAVLHYPNGSEEYRYSYTGWIDRKVGVPGTARTHTDKEHESLTVRVENGRVTGLRYVNTANPEDNLSR
jgi:hypothetical protein